jgi:hypothetical protein
MAMPLRSVFPEVFCCMNTSGHLMIDNEYQTSRENQKPTGSIIATSGFHQKVV